MTLDDYGTGYSSLTHLLKFPIDILKLDRGLITGIDTNTRNQALVAGIVEMAQRLSMEVIAEGVEREAEFTVVKNLGCDYVQGFFIAKPCSVDDVRDFFSDENRADDQAELTKGCL